MACMLSLQNCELTTATATTCELHHVLALSWPLSPTVTLWNGDEQHGLWTRGLKLESQLPHELPVCVSYHTQAGLEQ